MAPERGVTINIYRLDIEPPGQSHLGVKAVFYFLIILQFSFEYQP